jgi:hypothetical protein
VIGMGAEFNGIDIIWSHPTPPWTPAGSAPQPRCALPRSRLKQCAMPYGVEPSSQGARTYCLPHPHQCPPPRPSLPASRLAAASSCQPALHHAPYLQSSPPPWPPPAAPPPCRARPEKPSRSRTVLPARRRGEAGPAMRASPGRQPGALEPGLVNSQTTTRHPDTTALIAPRRELGSRP